VYTGVVINSSQSPQRVQVRQCFPAQAASTFQRQQTRRQKSRLAADISTSTILIIIIIIIDFSYMYIIMFKEI